MVLNQSSRTSVKPDAPDMIETHGGALQLRINEMHRIGEKLLVQKDCELEGQCIDTDASIVATAAALRYSCT